MRPISQNPQNLFKIEILLKLDVCLDVFYWKLTHSLATYILKLA